MASIRSYIDDRLLFPGSPLRSKGMIRRRCGASGNNVRTARATTPSLSEACRASTCSGGPDGGRNFVEVRRRHLQIGRVDPAVNLVRRACSNDCSGHSGHCQHPSDCHRRDGRFMAFRDRPKCTAQRQIPLQVGSLKLGSAAAPVVLREPCHSISAKALGEEP